MQYASIKSRCAAFLIDLLVLWTMSFLATELLVSILSAFSEYQINAQSEEFIHKIVWGGFFINVISMIGYLGFCDGILLPATIGKMFLRLRVVSTEGAHMSITHAMVRWLYKMSPFIIVLYIGEYILLGKIDALRNHQEFKGSDFFLIQLIGTLLMLFSLGSAILASRNKQKQALHDKMAETFVIKIDDMGLLQTITKKTAQWLKFLRKNGHSD